LPSLSALSPLRVALLTNACAVPVQNGGSLTLEQVALLAAELGFPLKTQEAFAEAMQVMDANSDGDVDCAEFEAWWKGQISARGNGNGGRP
jgi:hypothetical protein